MKQIKRTLLSVMLVMFVTLFQIKPICYADEVNPVDTTAYEPGLYDSEMNLLADWKTLTGTYMMDLSLNYLPSNYKGTNGDGETVYNLCAVMSNNSELSSGKTLVMGNDIEVIGEYAFHGSTITNVQISNSVTTLQCYAFSGSKLTSLNIPNTVTTLNSLIVETCLSGMSYVENIVFEEGSSITSLPAYLFRDCLSLKSVRLPSSVNTLPSDMFYNCPNITSYSIPHSITTIDANTFEGSYIESLYVPNTVTTLNCNTLNYGAFASATKLTSVAFEENSALSSLPSFTFRECTALTDISLPIGLGLERCVFYGCSALTHIVVPNNVVLTGGVFQQCVNLKTIYLTSGCSAVMQSVLASGISYLLDGDANVSVYVEATKEDFISYENWNQSSTGVLQPVYYGTTAEQYQCALYNDGHAFVNEVDTPDAHTTNTIYTCSYCGYTYIDTVVTEHEYGEVHYDEDLGYNVVECSICGDKKEIKQDGFFDADGNQLASWETLVNDYGMSISTNYSAWGASSSTTSPYYIINKYFPTTTKVVISDDETKMGTGAFYGCSTLTEIEIGSGITTLGDAAFRKCTSLKGMIIPDTVTGSAAGSTFRECTALEYVIYPSTFTTFNKGYELSGCSSLKYLALSGTPSQTNGSSLPGTNMLAVYIPDSVTATSLSTSYANEIYTNSNTIVSKYTKATIHTGYTLERFMCETIYGGHNLDENNICNRCGESIVVSSFVVSMPASCELSVEDNVLKGTVSVKVQVTSIDESFYVDITPEDVSLQYEGADVDVSADSDKQRFQIGDMERVDDTDDYNDVSTITITSPSPKAGSYSGSLTIAITSGNQ